MLIDVHCHLTDEAFTGENDAERVLDRARAAGVERFVVSGFDYPSSKRCFALSSRFRDVYFCVGLHPEELDRASEEDLDGLEELAKSEKCVAIGEIGLDYHFEDNPSKEKQKAFFKRQIDLASKLKLPFVVHSRDACADTSEILLAAKKEGKIENGFLMHCYSYSAECVSTFEKLGGYFSFGGTVTFKNAKKVQASAFAVSKDRILTETDCPYLTPEPLRGRFPNEPAHVRYVAEKIASLRGEEREALEEQMKQNAERLFFRMR